MKKQFISVISILVLSASFVFPIAVFADVADNYKKFEKDARQLQESQAKKLAELESKLLTLCEKYSSVGALDDQEPEFQEKCNELMSEQED
jgi:peptidoglycan hydrolase CwlO-like protein